MRPIKEITNTKAIEIDEINASNYQIIGIANTAQILFDKEINEYRTNIDYAQPDERENFYLNGTRSRKYNSLYGQVNITRPVLRKKGFYPSFIDPWKRDSKEVDLLVFNSFMNGSSTRKIQNAMAELGIACSRSKVSRISQRYRKAVNEIETRDLSESNYSIISLDATYVNILSDDPDIKGYKKKPLLRALGLNAQTGYWELLSLKVYEHENTTCYTDFLNGIRQRGLRRPVLFLRDFHKGITKAIRKVFPESFSQGCMFHLCQNIYRNLPRKVEQELKEQIFSLVREENPALRKQDLNELVEIYGEEYPKAINVLLKNLEDTMAWSVLNCEFRTNNVNERNNQEDKRLIKAKGSFKSIESAESILAVNTQRYLADTALKKPADLEKIQDMNRRFKAMSELISEDIINCFLDSRILERPPAISTPMLWLDTIDIAYDCFGQTLHVKILVCYGLKKAHRRRHFLWACPLFASNLEDIQFVLEQIRASCRKEPEIVILPGDDSTLLNAVSHVFSHSKIQVDLFSFRQMIADFLPEDYRNSFISSFNSVFENASQPGYSGEILELIEKSLSCHHQKEAYRKFIEYKGYLLTFLNIGINYFYNFKSTQGFKTNLILKRDDENNHSFFKKQLKKIQNYTWDIPYVYVDEVKILFKRFENK